MATKENLDISLEEFEKEMKRRLGHFVRNWVANNKESPDIYPMKMWPGDWFEQFVTTDIDEGVH